MTYKTIPLYLSLLVCLTSFTRAVDAKDAEDATLFRQETEKVLDSFKLPERKAGLNPIDPKRWQAFLVELKTALGKIINKYYSTDGAMNGSKLKQEAYRQQILTPLKEELKYTASSLHVSEYTYEETKAGWEYALTVFLCRRPFLPEEIKRISDDLEAYSPRIAKLVTQDEYVAKFKELFGEQKLNDIVRPAALKDELEHLTNYTSLDDSGASLPITFYLTLLKDKQYFFLARPHLPLQPETVSWETVRKITRKDMQEGTLSDDAKRTVTDFKDGLEDYIQRLVAACGQSRRKTVAGYAPLANVFGVSGPEIAAIATRICVAESKDNEEERKLESGE